MLGKKLCRELWEQKTQFFAIFVMSFLGLMVYSGMDAEHSGGVRGAEQYYIETNLADYWIKGSYFGEDDKRALEKLDEVNAVQRTLMVEGKLPAVKTEQEEAVLLLQFVDDDQISMPLLIEGEAFTTDKKGIWLGELFAEAQKLRIGDELTVKIGQEQITQPIRGIIRAPEYVYYTSGRNELVPDYTAFGYAFLPGSCYPQDGERSIYDTLQVDVKEEKAADAYLKEKFKRALDQEDLLIADRMQNASYASFQSEMDQHYAFSFLFPAVFLLIAFLGIVTTMTRMTAKQRTQIGTMKALGFSNGAVLLHYISFGGIVSLIGAVSGAIAGYCLLTPLILVSLTGVYQLPAWNTYLSKGVYAAILLVTLLSIVTCYLACKKELSEAPAQALRPKPPKLVGALWLEKSRLWKRLDFAWQWNLRDIRKNRLRTLMGALGTAGCMMLLISAFGCMDSIAYMPVEMYEHLELGSWTLFFEDGTTPFTVGEYARKYAGQEIQIRAAELSVLDQNGNAVIENGNVTVVGEGNLMHYQDADGDEVFLTAQDVMLSKKMAELLQVQVGDIIRLRLLGDDDIKSLRVTKLYRHPNVQGITVSRQLFESLQYDFQPTKLLTNIELPSEITEERAVKSVMNSTQQYQDMLVTLETMNMIVYLLGAAAIILGLVVLYNLSELSFVEKLREYATLKALGMGNGTLKRIIAVQNFIIGGIGTLLGIPLGQLLLALMLESMNDSSDMKGVISQGSYLSAVCITMGVVWLSCLLMSTRLNKIDMVDALKGVE